jgi:hypothetical protein
MASVRDPAAALPVRGYGESNQGRLGVEKEAGVIVHDIHVLYSMGRNRRIQNFELGNYSARAFKFKVSG